MITSNILEETLKREITEEVDVEVSNLRYVNSSLFETDTGLSVVDIVFLCEYQSGEPYAKCIDEVNDVFLSNSRGRRYTSLSKRKHYVSGKSSTGKPIKRR